MILVVGLRASIITKLWFGNKMRQKYQLSCLLACIAGSFIAISAFAQTPESWPTRPITMVVPFPPGGVADTVGRPIAEAFTRILGQPVVVVNRPGANMVLGAQECARSDPDGHTICVTSADAMSYNPFTLTQMTYDPDKDFSAMGTIGVSPLVLTVPTALPANSVKELIALT